MNPPVGHSAAIPEATTLHHLQALPTAVRGYLAQATQALRNQLAAGDPMQAERPNEQQRALHGLAWMATTAQATLVAAQWGLRLAAAGRLGAPERLLLGIGIGEYLEQLAGGIPMCQRTRVIVCPCK